jgi:hypothetical protein
MTAIALEVHCSRECTFTRIPLPRGSGPERKLLEAMSIALLKPTSSRNKKQVANNFPGHPSGTSNRLVRGWAPAARTDGLWVVWRDQDGEGEFEIGQILHC